MWAEAAKAFENIPKSYPKHSMADDGYALQDLARIRNKEKAMEAWSKQVKESQKEINRRRILETAWNSFMDGKTDNAIAWAEEAQNVVLQLDNSINILLFHIGKLVGVSILLGKNPQGK